MSRERVVARLPFQWSEYRRRLLPLRAERRRTAKPCEPTPFYDDNMTWEQDGGSLEIRTQGQLPDGRPALDEIVAHSAFVHLEQMAHDHWWMGLEAGGKRFHLNFGVQDGHLWVRLSDQGEENTEWEGDSRERPIPGVAE